MSASTRAESVSRTGSGTVQALTGNEVSPITMSSPLTRSVPVRNSSFIQADSDINAATAERRHNTVRADAKKSLLADVLIDEKDYSSFNIPAYKAAY